MNVEMFHGMFPLWTRSGICNTTSVLLMGLIINYTFISKKAEMTSKGFYPQFCNRNSQILSVVGLDSTELHKSFVLQYGN